MVEALGGLVKACSLSVLRELGSGHFGVTLLDNSA